jgi:hypothetical protein
MGVYDMRFGRENEKTSFHPLPVRSETEIEGRKRFLIVSIEWEKIDFSRSQCLAVKLKNLENGKSVWTDRNGDR